MEKINTLAVIREVSGYFDGRHYVKNSNCATELSHVTVRVKGKILEQCGTETHGNKWMARLLKKMDLRLTTPRARSVARYV